MGQDREPVADRQRVLDVVGDEDDAEALRPGARSTWRSTIAASLTPSADVGSSRISTRAPKYSARAIASVWRSPPDSVPTSCAGSRTWIPISSICSVAIRRGLGHVEAGERAPARVGSEPTKKLRLMLISGSTARSW